MVVYRGDYCSDFKIIQGKKSRYGFPALFFATNTDLAELYAKYRAKEENCDNNGFIFQFEIDKPKRDINFDFKSAYSSDFRNLIYKLKRDLIPSARIYNIIDYPSKKMMKPTFSDVIVVFNFDCIKSYNLIKFDYAKRENI